MAEDGKPTEPAEGAEAVTPAPKASKPVPKTKTRAILRSSRRLRFAVVALVIVGLFAGGIYYERTRNKPQKKDPYAGLAWGTTSTYNRALAVSGATDDPGLGPGAGGDPPSGSAGPPGREVAGSAAVGAGTTPTTSDLGPAVDPCSLLTDSEVVLVLGEPMRAAESDRSDVLNGVEGIRTCIWSTSPSGAKDFVMQVAPEGSGDLFYETFRLGSTDLPGLGDRSYLAATPPNLGLNVIVAQRGRHTLRVSSRLDQPRLQALTSRATSRLSP